MNNILCIETTIGKCSVALRCRGQEDYIEAQDNFMQSEMLFPLIQELFKRRNIDYNVLDVIACTIGPGSFTGVRIGIAAVQGIKRACPSIKTLGVSTLDVMASDVSSSKKKIVILNAYSKEFYVQEFNSDGVSSELYLLPQDKLKEKIDGNTIIVSDISGKTLIDEKSCKFVSINAKALMSKVKKVIESNQLDAYENVSPLYIKEPNITI